jgi:hypothetical protein
MTRRVASVAPVALVMATLAILWGVGGVGAAQALRAVAYEAAFVVVPGVAAFVALDGKGRRMLTNVAVGWAFGYALEVGAFCATAAAGARWMFWLYPVVVIVAAIGWIGLRRRRPHAPAAARGDMIASHSTARLAVGVASALALAYAALGAFPQLPLPQQVSSVSYHADQVFGVALTAETAHHWPPTMPWVSGLHLNYHWLAFAHSGATAQVTGLDPALIVFRLVTPLMLLAVFLLAFAAGTRMSGDERIGALGVVVLLLVGELHLTTAPTATFLGTFREALWKSSTFLFGLVFFLAALTLLWDQLDPDRTPRRRTWFVLVPLLFVAGGAKGAVPFVLLGGVGVYGACRFVATRRFDRRVIGAGAVIAMTFGLDWIVFFRGTGESFVIAPFASIRQSLFYLKVSPYVPPVVHPLLAVAGVAALLVPLAGVVVVLARRRVSPVQAYLLSLFVGGFAGFCLADAPGGILPELWFLTYAHAAGVLLAGWGVLAAWHLGDRDPALRTKCLLVVGIVVVAFGLWSGVVNEPFSWEARSDRVYLAFLAVGILIVADAWARGRRLGMARRAAAITALALVVGGGALDAPLSLSGNVRSIVSERPAYPRDTPSSRGMTKPLFNGLRWVRAHTPANAVLAVNNHYVATNAPRYLYYSAFAERRVFLESWWYTMPALALGTPRLLKGAQPFPARWELNQRVFEKADSEAASALHQRYGVTYLLVDHTHGPASPDVSKLGTLVHSNSALSVYALG